MNEQSLYYRDTWAEVDLNSIAANVSAVKRRLPEDVGIIAVVKANAYGHGDVQVAAAAIDSGASMLAVAFLDEALSLRKKGIQAPILVLGASRPEDVNLASKARITLTAFHKDWIKKAKSVLLPDATLSIHIKVDTGMGRIGARSKEDLMVIESIISQDQRLHFAGIFTHFATADELAEEYFQKQLQQFEEIVKSLKSRPPCVHSGNSAASLRYPSAYFNAVRLGIVMYGLSPSAEIKPSLPIKLEEAFSLHSRMTQVKRIKKGEKISYGGTYEAGSDEWIGTIPIGYADGWVRRLQGQEVIVNGIRCPIVGRICMDQCMIKLPYEMEPGEKVTLIGRQHSDFISIDEIAAKLETINYEIPCLISARVPRVYKRDGTTVAVNNGLFPENN